MQHVQAFLPYRLITLSLFTVVLLNHCLYLLVHVFCREAQLFVQHFVRSGETERFQSPNLTVGAYQAFQRNGQSGGQTEYFAFAGITLS